MQSTYELPSTLAADLEKLREQTGRFASGEISATEYRSFRVPQGVYEQRQDGTFMLRVRLPAGGVLPHQMRKLADVARRFGSGRLHVTTRQDIQVHDVSLENIHPALLELYSAGLSSKGGGGNTVRNIIACPDAGVCAEEIFDVTPHAIALTEFMLSDPTSFRLPRKYKIALSGCAADCVGATVNDLGLIARQGKDGFGFAVYAGGGMGPHARVAQLLEEFVPAGEVHLVAEAVKRVFDKHGNRRNKHKARLRYLVEEKGFEKFKELYRAELSLVRQEAPPAPRVRELHCGTDRLRTKADHPTGAKAGPKCKESSPSDGFDAWRASNACAQKQKGHYLVHIPVFLGDLPADTVEKLADVADLHGEGMIRATPSQNFVIRWVPEADLPGLHQALSDLGLAGPGTPRSPVVRELIACTGAATCRLGYCLSQELAKASRDALEQADLDLDDAVDLRLYMNGCPNSCGRHPIASIGLFGSARRVNDRLVPHYVVQLGGRLGRGQTRLAEGKDPVPARKIPAFLVDVLRAFRESDQYPDFDAYLDAGGRESAGRIAGRYKHVPSFTEDRNYYYDWGAEELFSLAGRGPGECSAGVFDLITVDLASARQALDEGKLIRATGLAARALLITQGEEAKDAADALRLFERHFVEAGLVDGSFRDLITSARQHVLSNNGKEGSDADAGHVAALVSAVEDLYESMDQSLRFHPATPPGTEPKDAEAETVASDQPADITIDREADFHGVTCPLNYVKTKLLLGQMSTGQVLSVLLDEAGAKNVPESAEKDGHEVLSKQQQGDRWRVIIRKG